MAFTYDFNTWLYGSQVRLLIADTDSANPIFQDNEIEQFLNLECSQTGLMLRTSGYQVIPFPPQVFSVRRAAALALDSLASNKSRLAGALMVLDIKINFGDAARALRDQAKGYRDAENDMGNFAVSEMVNDPFSARERVWKQFLRIESQ